MVFLYWIFYCLLEFHQNIFFFFFFFTVSVNTSNSKLRISPIKFFDWYFSFLVKEYQVERHSNICFYSFVVRHFVFCYLVNLYKHTHRYIYVLDKWAYLKNIKLPSREDFQEQLIVFASSFVSIINFRIWICIDFLKQESSHISI